MKTDDPIPIFVKADQEDLYFPQPKDTTNVKDAIRTYKMCLYTLDRDIKPENLVNKSQIPEEELSEKNLKNEEKVNQQVKKLSKNK